MEEKTEENDVVEDIDDKGDTEDSDAVDEEKATDDEKTSVKDGSQNLNLILDIPLTVTVELGRTKMLINDLLQLSHGSVVELTKLVGEPLEVLVNKKLVARGEVVVVNEKFGIRLTDIVSPLERVQSLS